MTDRILRLPQVIDRTGLSRTTIHRLEKRQAFPARVALTEVAVGWREADIQAWIEARRPQSAAA